MKTVLVVLILSVMVASVAAGIHMVKADSDDWIYFASGVTLFSPVNRTYSSPNLTLNLTLFSAGSMGYIDSRVSMNYSIDGKLDGRVPLTVSNPGVHVITNGAGLVNLPELPEGSHSLTIYLEGFNQKYYEPRFLSYVDTVYFSIDLTPPNVSILSPVNKAYTVANITEARIPLDFTVDENVSQVAYSLDGQNDTVIAGNTTLTGLPIGSHNVTVEAVDLAGHAGASETVNFTVAEDLEIQPEPEPFPTTLVIASVATVAVIGAGLIVYFKKRKHKA